MYPVSWNGAIAVPNEFSSVVVTSLSVVSLLDDAFVNLFSLCAFFFSFTPICWWSCSAPCEPGRRDSGACGEDTLLADDSNGIFILSWSLRRVHSSSCDMSIISPADAFHICCSWSDCLLFPIFCLFCCLLSLACSFSLCFSRSLAFSTRSFSFLKDAFRFSYECFCSLECVLELPKEVEDLMSVI